MFKHKIPPEPWHAFLTDIDASVSTPLRLDCIGGFVVTLLYGFDRPTADVDILELAPRHLDGQVMELAMRGGPLNRKHHIYLDRVTVAMVPENYEQRLTEMFPGVYKHLRLMALDPYDLALSKLERNVQKDRDDVRFLAKTIPLDIAILKNRYEQELRWQLGNPLREDLTLQLWTEMLHQDQTNGIA